MATEAKKPIFDDAVKSGLLILVEPDETRKCKCTLWFDFTMNAIRKIKEGDLVAIHNFNTNRGTNVYSLFRLTSVQPRHFALGKDDLKAYPGNLEESARSVFPDFTEQESESTEDITKIYCEAYPINLQYTDNKELKRENLTEDESLPITGSEVMLVSKDLMEFIYNYGIDKTQPSTVKAGSLIKTEGVNILMNSEELMKVHFALFGYTGAGKSNLVSTLLSTILQESENKNKFVLFDIMDEYTGLLIDQLLADNVMLISLGERYLPEAVIQYLTTKNESQLDDAAGRLLEGMLLPKRLRPHKDLYLPFIKRLLKEDKIKVIELTATRTVEEFSEDFWDDVFPDYIKGVTKMDLERTLNDIFRGPDARRVIDPILAQSLIDRLTSSKKPTTGDSKAKTFNEMIDHIIEKLEDLRDEKSHLSDNIRINIDQIVNELNDEKKKSLMIITSEDPNVMRKYAKNIGNLIYRARSRTATISPVVSFVFDEADEFIPQNASGTKADSRDIVERLSRRGRKFGLGVGLATQRITYLDTNIMGQPHTYFISKLPRASDRERVGEAFGLIQDDFKQTLKFKKGEWLFISHDAAGLDAEPIPIHANNTEDRILKFLGKTENK
jgi:DNA helicase HerA-like ATPase